MNAATPKAASVASQGVDRNRVQSRFRYPRAAERGLLHDKRPSRAIHPAVSCRCRSGVASRARPHLRSTPTLILPRSKLRVVRSPGPPSLFLNSQRARAHDRPVAQAAIRVPCAALSGRGRNRTRSRTIPRAIRPIPEYRLAQRDGFAAEESQARLEPRKTAAQTALTHFAACRRRMDSNKFGTAAQATVAFRA